MAALLMATDPNLQNVRFQLVPKQSVSSSPFSIFEYQTYRDKVLE